MMTRFVVFVRDRPGIRIFKEAKALKKIGGYNLTLLCRTYDAGLFDDLFDKIITYCVIPLGDGILGSSLRFFDNRFTHVFSKIEESNLIKIVKRLNPDLFHCVTEPNHVCRLVMRHAKCPVIFDGYDFSGISEGIENLPTDVRIDEKYCFEHADGIIHKGLPFEIKFYEKIGYSIGAQILRWMDYCDEDLIVNNEISCDIVDKYHLVYTGQVATNATKRYNYYMPLAKSLSKQKINFHIYPPPFQGYRLFQEYYDLDHKNEYFHFHNSLNNYSLIKKISQYHYGLFIHEKEKYSPRFTREKIEVIMGNKLFTYLEAGLPIIASNHLTSVKDIVKKYKIGFTIDDEEITDLHEILDNVNYTHLKDNLPKAREKLTIKKNMQKLDDFYSDLLAGV